MVSAFLLPLLTPTPAVAQDPGTRIVEVRRDARRCPAPMCGGYWVNPVNTGPIACTDGTRGDWCYVADIDFTPLGLSEPELTRVMQAAASQQALLQVSGRTFEFGGARYLRLEASEAWVVAP